MSSQTSFDSPTYCLAKYKNQRGYVDKNDSSVLPGGHWGNNDNPNVDNPGVDFFPKQTAYYGYCGGHRPQAEGGCKGGRCWNDGTMLDLLEIPREFSSQLKGCGDCSGGHDWICCGLCAMNWNTVNKADCCDPAGNAKQSGPHSNLSCAPWWCPFSQACAHQQVTADYCLGNPDDGDCLALCLNYINNYESTSGTDPDDGTDKAVKVKAGRPDWCDGFMTKYCRRHSTSSATNLNLCACLTSKQPDPECLDPKCNSGTGAWLTVSHNNMIKNGNCQGVCMNMIEGKTSKGNVYIYDNDMKSSCSRFSTNGQVCAPSPSGHSDCKSLDAPSSTVPPSSSSTQSTTLTERATQLQADLSSSDEGTRRQAQLKVAGIVLGAIVGLVILLVVLRRVVG